MPACMYVLCLYECLYACKYVYMLYRQTKLSARYVMCETWTKRPRTNDSETNAIYLACVY
jgi:hypothetical protein